MRKASNMFTDAQRKTVSEAVFAAEQGTAAEIVPVVAAVSGRYDRAEDLVGMITGLGAMILTWLLFQRVDENVGGWDGLPLTVPLPALVGIMVLGFAAGGIAATRMTWLRRPFISARQMEAEVANRAGQLFHDQRVHHTAGAGGVMIYLSLMERKTLILADRTALQALGRPALDAACRDLTAQVRRGDVPGALCATIETLGQGLAKTLPRRDDDCNELSDVLVLIDD